MRSKLNLSGIVGFTDTRHVYRPFQIVKYISDHHLHTGLRLLIPGARPQLRERASPEGDRREDQLQMPCRDNGSKEVFTITMFLTNRSCSKNATNMKIMANSSGQLPSLRNWERVNYDFGR